MRDHLRAVADDPPLERRVGAGRASEPDLGEPWVARIRRNAHEERV